MKTTLLAMLLATVVGVSAAHSQDAPPGNYWSWTQTNWPPFPAPFWGLPYFSAGSNDNWLLDDRFLSRPAAAVETNTPGFPDVQHPAFWVNTNLHAEMFSRTGAMADKWAVAKMQSAMKGYQRDLWHHMSEEDAQAHLIAYIALCPTNRLWLLTNIDFSVITVTNRVHLPDRPDLFFETGTNASANASKFH